MNFELRPVLIDPQGRIYSPDDILPDGERAAKVVERVLANDPLAERFIALSREEQCNRDG